MQGPHHCRQRLHFVGAHLDEILQPYNPKRPWIGQTLDRQLPGSLNTGEQVVCRGPLRKAVNPRVGLVRQQAVLQFAVLQVGMQVNAVLRSQSLPGADFRQPAEVLAGLNGAFQMEKQNNLFFTIWYGVYRLSTRQLAYASAGHPPALLVYPAGLDAAGVTRLAASHPPIGMFPDATYSSGQSTVPAGGRLFVYSDGACEIDRENRGLWPFDEFVDRLLFHRANGPRSSTKCFPLFQRASCRRGFPETLLRPHPPG